MFVDADDTIETGLATALAFAQNTFVDMLWCQWRKQKDNSEFELVKSDFEYSKIISGIDFCEHYYDMMVHGAPWSYLIKKSYIDSLGIAFVEDRRMEDTDWVEKHLFYCNSFSCSQSIIYSYFNNEESTMHSFNADKDADALMYSIRRMQFADIVASSAKQFSNRIYEYASNQISRIFSFRHLTRYNAKSIYTLFTKSLDPDTESYLSQHECFHKWPHFTRLCIKHSLVICAIISIIHPFAKIARSIYRFLFI